MKTAKINSYEEYTETVRRERAAGREISVFGEVRPAVIERYSNFINSSFCGGVATWQKRPGWVELLVFGDKYPVSNTFDFFKARSLGLIDEETLEGFGKHRQPIDGKKWEKTININKDCVIDGVKMGRGEYTIRYTPPNNAGAYEGGVHSGSRSGHY
jgi:hypothetical protein